MLIDSEDLVDHCLALLLSACTEAEHDSREHVEEQTLLQGIWKAERDSESKSSAVRHNFRNTTQSQHPAIRLHFPSFPPLHCSTFDYGSVSVLMH